MPSKVTFYLATEPPPSGEGDVVNDWLHGTVFAAQGGPFQIESRVRDGTPGTWTIYLGGTVAAGAQAGITTALEASPHVSGGVVWGTYTEIGE